jgi:hypothetical protein
MARYSRKRKPATPKTKRKRKPAGTRTAALVERKKSKKPKKRIVTPRSIKKKSKVASTKKVVKVRAKRTRLARPKKTAAKKPKAAKKRAVHPRRAAKTIIKSKKRRPLTKKQRVARATKAAQTRAAKLWVAQQKARGQAKRSGAQKKARVAKKALEQDRLKRSLIIEDLPRATPKERKKSAETYWDRVSRKFRPLLREAQRTGQTPSSKRQPRRVDSRQRIGEQRMVRINRVLTSASVEDILYRVDRVGRTMSGLYSVWWADVGFSGLGERLFGSGNVILKSNDPDARAFQAQGYDSSGVWNTYQGMLQALERVLEDYATTPRSVVYVHYVRVQNFDWR